MRYQNGITYTFHVGECTAYVRLHNYGPQAVQNFNEALGYEILRAYEKEANPIERLDFAHQEGTGQEEGQRAGN